jgi:hypothetical protein
MPGVQLQMPFDIILSAVGLDHKDIENRMHLTQTVSHDPSGREVLRVFDRMGNASSRMIIPDVRGTRYPAATLWWDTRSPLKSQISIGNSETLTVDAWLSKVSLANRSVVFRMSFLFAHAEEPQQSPLPWVCCQ